MADFVEICNVCARKAIIEAVKRIIDSDKVCHSYSDLNFGVTFFGTQCISKISDILDIFENITIFSNPDLDLFTVYNVMFFTTHYKSLVYREFLQPAV